MQSASVYVRCHWMSDHLLVSESGEKTRKRSPLVTKIGAVFTVRITHYQAHFFLCTWNASYQWPCHLMRVPPYGYHRAICLPWDVLTPLYRTVVYRELWEIYKRVQRYPSVSIYIIPPDTEKLSIGEYPY